MDKYVDQYRKFKKFIEKPEAYLYLGNVDNVRRLDNRYDDDDDDNDIVIETPASLALKSLLDGKETIPRIYHMDIAKDIKIRETDTTRYLSGSQDTETLIEIAEKAPYGNTINGTTEVDESIRLCYQIPDGHKYQIQGLHSSIVEKIRNNMYPGRDIWLKPNKMNIYQKGGHFARHKDSPKPGVIGTVVVFNESPSFTGGNLVLDDKERFNSGIVAFYTNIPHYVEPVQSGTRITTTYYIMENNAETPVTVQKPIEALEQHVPFGIVLSETYGEGEKNLKGKDQIVENLLKHSFKLEILPVVLTYHQEYYGEGCQDLICKVHRCEPSDFESYCAGLRVGLRPRPENRIRPSMEFIHLGDSYGKLIDSSSQDYIEHVGNECQIGFYNNIYLNRVLIVRSL